MSIDDDILDPALIARLARWFGESLDVAAGSVRPTATDPADEKRLAALDAVDPQLVDSLGAQSERADKMLANLEPLTVAATDISLFDSAPYHESTSTAPVEYDQPDDIAFFVSERNTPQAILRDLHRPVLSFGGVKLRPMVDIERLRMQTARAHIADALLATSSHSMPALAAAIIEQDRAEIDELMARPWQDAKPDHATEQELVRDSEAAEWFGVLGGYDPDL